MMIQVMVLHPHPELEDVLDVHPHPVAVKSLMVLPPKGFVVLCYIFFYNQIVYNKVLSFHGIFAHVEFE